MIVCDDEEEDSVAVSANGVRRGASEEARRERDAREAGKGWSNVETTLLWVRKDLRVKYNRGLALAMQTSLQSVLPVFVIGRSTLEVVSAVEGRYLRDALQAYDRDLQQVGSALTVVIDEDSDDETATIARTALAIGADRVVVENDHTSELLDAVGRLRESTSVDVATWESALYHPSDGPENLPQTYAEWKRGNWTRFSTALTDETVSDAISRPPPLKAPKSTPDWSERITQWAGRREDTTLETRVEEDLRSCFTVPLRFPISEENAELVLQDALAAAEGYEKVDIGRSLAPYTHLGCLSPRRACEIIETHEKQHGRYFPLVYRDGAKRALQVLHAHEWHGLLAEHDRAVGKSWRYWEWNGTLCRYQSAGDPKNPTLLCIHGFGASSTHWDKNIEGLRERFNVWSLDLSGFGRSEKPTLQYTQAYWEKHVRDFVMQVIKKPVFVAGNSIGGYVSAAFAADGGSDLCQGLMLLNTAGPLYEPGEPRPVPDAKPGRFRFMMQEYRFLRMGVSSGLFTYLQRNIRKTLGRVYTDNPDGASEELAYNIFRDSTDPGAKEVLASGFILPPPRALNDLLDAYDGPVLILQGKNDPLNNAVARAEKLKRVCPRARLEVIAAGHCPHDELPSVANEIISSFMAESLEASQVAEERHLASSL